MKAYDDTLFLCILQKNDKTQRDVWNSVAGNLQSKDLKSLQHVLLWMRHKSGTRVLGMYNGLSEPVSFHWCLPVLSLQSWANDILYKERSYSVQHASVTVQTYFKISFVNIFLFCTLILDYISRITFMKRPSSYKTRTFVSKHIF